MDPVINFFANSLVQRKVSTASNLHISSLPEYEGNSGSVWTGLLRDMFVGDLQFTLRFFDSYISPAIGALRQVWNTIDAKSTLSEIQ